MLHMTRRGAGAPALLASVNATPDHDRAGLTVARATLRMAAEADNAAYPQYAGHWDGWGVCRVKRRVTTKMGVAFEKGDLAICRPSIFDPETGKRTITLYSARNAVDTGIFARDVVELPL